MWQNGRRSADYYKFKLLNIDSKLILIDCYLLKFNHNCTILQHTDIVKGKKHYRLNIVYKGSAKFRSKINIFSLFNTVFFFRPDISPHSLFNSNKELRIFSFGFAF